MPLFEPNPRNYLRYLFLELDPDAAKSVAVVENVSEWLESRGIDLIFVPIPKMTEVYADRVVKEHPPAGRIAAPRIRRMIRTLLAKDVEVLDLLPMFLERREDGEPLYEPADPHWSNRAGLLFLDELVRRLLRYEEILTSRGEPPRYRAECRRYSPPQAAYGALDPDQGTRVAPSRRLVRGAGRVGSPSASGRTPALRSACSRLGNPLQARVFEVPSL